VDLFFFSGDVDFILFCVIGCSQELLMLIHFYFPDWVGIIQHRTQKLPYFVVMVVLWPMQANLWYGKEISTAVRLMSSVVVMGEEEEVMCDTIMEVPARTK
jgi:hypothetical protein